MAVTIPILTLSASVNPVAWKAPTLGAKRMGSKVVPYAAPNQEVEAYKNALQEQWMPQYGGVPIDYPVRLEWSFARRLNTYESAGGRTVTKHKQDLTNLVKSSEDALQPWLLKNDVWVHSMSAVIDEQSKDVTDPYVTLIVRPL